VNYPRSLGLAIASGLALAATTAHARRDGAESCLDRAMSNYEFAECTGSIVEASDQRLNTAWSRLFRLLGGRQSARGRILLQQQRAWLASKAKACAEYWAPDAGREDQVIHGPLCKAAFIDARTKDLNDRYRRLNP
jgi:uncharacterized protein YecT (DUF1311 family)